MNTKLGHTLSKSDVWNTEKSSKIRKKKKRKSINIKGVKKLSGNIIKSITSPRKLSGNIIKSITSPRKNSIDKINSRLLINPLFTATISQDTKFKDTFVLVKQNTKIRVFLNHDSTTTNYYVYVQNLNTDEAGYIPIKCVNIPMDPWNIYNPLIDILCENNFIGLYHLMKYCYLHIDKNNINNIDQICMLICRRKLLYEALESLSYLETKIHIEKSENILFRDNSVPCIMILIRIFKCKEIESYKKYIVGKLIKKIDKLDNIKQIHFITLNFLNNISLDLNSVPKTLASALHRIRKGIDRAYNNSRISSLYVSSIFFLRFFCPGIIEHCIINPKNSSRYIISAKSMQKFANFAEHEEISKNKMILKRRKSLNKFLQIISSSIFCDAKEDESGLFHMKTDNNQIINICVNLYYIIFKYDFDFNNDLTSEYSDTNDNTEYSDNIKLSTSTELDTLTELDTPETELGTSETEFEFDETCSAEIEENVKSSDPIIKNKDILLSIWKKCKHIGNVPSDIVPVFEGCKMMSPDNDVIEKKMNIINKLFN